MIWEDLIKTALIGTDRTKLSEDTLKALTALGIDPDAHPAKIVMDAVGLYAPMQKVARPIDTWQMALPEPCPPETAPLCHADSIQHLAMILNSNYHGEILNEFLGHMQRYRMVLPAEQLPVLLHRCRNNPQLWKLLQTVIGQKGHWLIQQNPDWHYLQIETQAEDWETGTKAMRVNYFQKYRSEKPQEAIALLTTQWAKEDFRTRLLFLNCLSDNLSLRDEAFLENSLKDRKKELRWAAAKLLARIAGAAFNTRISDKFKTILQFEKNLLKKDALELVLPELEDPFFKEHGIEPGQHSYTGGSKAGLIGQLISLLPPSQWKNLLGKNRLETLKLFARSKWNTLLFEAIIEASILHQDTDWMRAILQFISQEKNQALRPQLSFDRLFAVLPDDVFNETAILLFEQQRLLPDETDLLTKLLQNKVRPWEDKLSLCFLESLKEWILRSDNAWGGWHYKQVLAVAQYAVDPNRYKLFTQDWPEQARNWHSWVEPVERFLGIVSFRKKMALAFKNNDDEK